MRKQIIIGIGYSGSKVVNSFSKKMQQLNLSIPCCAMDTDSGALQQNTHVSTISLASEGCVEDILTRLGREHVQEWFPCDPDRHHVTYISTLKLDGGANLWRGKALLMFQDFLADIKRNVSLYTQLDQVTGWSDNERDIEVYIVASLSGGTGSGLFLPLADIIRKHYATMLGDRCQVTIKLLLICPDIYESQLSSEQKVKANANAYAALRELNQRNKQDNRPVQKVYLFNKNHRIASVSQQEQWIAEMLPAILNSRAGISEQPDQMYAGMSLMKITQPVRNILEYVAVRYSMDAVYHPAVFGENTEEIKLYFDEILNYFQQFRKKICSLGSKSSLADTAKQYYEELNQLYISGVADFKTVKEQVLSAFTDAHGAISVVSGFLKKNSSKPVSPVHMLAKIRGLLECIQAYIQGARIEEYEEVGEMSALPTYYLNQEPVQKPARSKYASGGESRFNQLLSEDKEVIGKKSEDYEQLYRDVQSISDGITRVKVAAYLHSLCTPLLELAQSYEQLLIQLPVYQTEWESNAKLCLVRNSESHGWIQFILASPEIRERAYIQYKEGITEGLYEEVIPGICYEKIADYILDKDIHKDMTMDDLIAQICAESLHAIEQSEFAKNHFTGTIAPLIADSCADNEFVTAVHRAIYFAQPALKASFGDTEIGDRVQKNYRQVFLSANAESVQPVISNMLSNLGESIDDLECYACVPEQEIWFCNEKVGVRLEEVLLANEETGSGFEAHNKALRMMEVHRTPMWNPYLRYDSYQGGSLPYISSSAEKKWLHSVGKAFLFGMLYGKIFTANCEDDQTVYHFSGKKLVQPILLDGSYVYPEDWQNAIRWLQRDRDLVQAWSKAFDELKTQEIQDLPSLRFGEYAVQEVTKAILTSELIQKLSGQLFSFCKGMEGVFQTQLLQVSKDVIYDYAYARFENREEFLLTYRTIVQFFVRTANQNEQELVLQFCNYRRVDDCD